MSASVRDMVIKVIAETSSFKTAMTFARNETRRLSAELKALKSDTSMEDAAENVQKNLEAQAENARTKLSQVQTQIDEITKKLTTVKPGSQDEQSLVGQAAKLDAELSNARAELNKIEQQAKTAKMDNLIMQAEQLSTLFMSLKLGLGDALDFFGDAADSADDAFVRRETAFIQATKNVEVARQTKDDLDALNRGLTEMATRIPQTYEELAGLLGEGAKLGVPYENLLEFTEVMAKLNVATNVAGESGAQAMAQFLNITEKAYDNLDRVGAALTELGNNSATTEQNILEMAHRASTGLSTVGMGTADILALSAALNSVGIEAQAGGSSVSKLGVTMDKAANVGAQNIDALIKRWNYTQGESVQSVYELYARLDELGSKDGWRAMESALGMTAKDTKALMDSALAAERFSKAMGQSVDEFAAGWNEDAASQMLNFFRALGSMDGGSEEENMLWVMDQLGIKEIRQSNMVRALANNWELYAHMLELGRSAYEENVALENEAERAFGTYESQRTMNANKAENAAEAMGRSIAAMRQPFDDFFGNLQQWYADWPTWAQNAVGRLDEVFGKAGNVLDFMGTLSFNALNITNAIKMLKEISAGSRIASAAGKTLAGAAAVGGAALLGVTLNELSDYVTVLNDRTDDLSKTLSGLQIVIDPVSKEAALAAIQEVQNAADGLAGGGDMEKYKNTSQVVRMGYGTVGMFGQALAYEQYTAAEQIDEIYQRYGELIREAEESLLQTQGDAQRNVIQARITALTNQMNREVKAAQGEMGTAVSEVVAGGLQAAGGADLLDQLAEKYNLLDRLLQAYNQGNAAYLTGSAGAIDEQLKALGIEYNTGWAMAGSENWVKGRVEALYQSLQTDVADIFSNGDLMAVMYAALSSGALEYADLGDDGLLRAMMMVFDLKEIADTGTERWKDLGKNSMLGLGQGVSENQETATKAAEDAAQALINAAANELGVRSPSTVFEAIGENIDLGLAGGIYARADEAIAAASWLAAQVESAMRSALDINSPSGVAKRMGVFLGEGLAQGIEGSLGRVERAAGSLASGVSAAGNRNIDVTLNLDGKTLTQMIVPMMDQALGEQLWQQ